jgi:hypothetical protein
VLFAAKVRVAREAARPRLIKLFMMKRIQKIQDEASVLKLDRSDGCWVCC